MFTWRREAPDRRGNVWRVTPAYHVFIACVAGVTGDFGRPNSLRLPFRTPATQANVFKKRDQIKMRDYMDRRVTPPKQVTPST